MSSALEMVILMLMLMLMSTYIPSVAQVELIAHYIKMRENTWMDLWGSSLWTCVGGDFNGGPRKWYLALDWKLLGSMHKSVVEYLNIYSLEERNYISLILVKNEAKALIGKEQSLMSACFWYFEFVQDLVFVCTYAWLWSGLVLFCLSHHCGHKVTLLNPGIFCEIFYI